MPAGLQHLGYDSSCIRCLAFLEVAQSFAKLFHGEWWDGVVVVFVVDVVVALVDVVGVMVVGVVLVVVVVVVVVVGVFVQLSVEFNLIVLL